MAAIAGTSSAVALRTANGSDFIAPAASVPNVSRPVAQQPLLLAIPFALLDRLPFVVLLLALGKPDRELDPAILVMKIERGQRITGTLDLADQTIDLFPSQQQFPRTGGIGTQMRRRRRQWTHVRADQHDLAVLDDDVRLLEIRPARPDRFDLPALERQPGLESLLDKIVVKRFAVFDDAHGDAIHAGDGLLAFARCSAARFRP